MWKRLERFQRFTRKFKVVRGMISYGCLWPCGNLIEQTFAEHRRYPNYDWWRVARFGIFGACFMAPTLYAWLRFSLIMWPQPRLISSVGKSITEQISFEPFSNTCFLFGMTLFEGKTFKEAREKVRHHFFDIYSVGVIYWPCVSCFCFMFVPLRNQVIVTSIFSMLWTAFLACFFSRPHEPQEPVKTTYSKKICI